MSNGDGTVLDGGAQRAQGEMFSVAQVQEQTLAMLAAYGKKPGAFSGKRLERDRAKVEVMLRMLGDPGLTDSDIARALKVSRNTVGALKRRAEEDGRLAPWRAQAGAKMKVAQGLAVDNFIEQLRAGQIKGKDAAVAVGIATDKVMAFEGLPTQVMEVRRKEIGVEALNEDMKRLKALVAEKAAAVEVAVVEVESET